MTKAVSTDGVRAVVYLSWENGQSFDYHHSSSAARTEYRLQSLEIQSRRGYPVCNSQANVGLLEKENAVRNALALSLLSALNRRHTIRRAVSISFGYQRPANASPDPPEKHSRFWVCSCLP